MHLLLQFLKIFILTTVSLCTGVLHGVMVSHPLKVNYSIKSLSMAGDFPEHPSPAPHLTVLLFYAIVGKLPPEGPSLPTVEGT